MIRSKSTLAACAALVWLAACGGGGDDGTAAGAAPAPAPAPAPSPSPSPSASFTVGASQAAAQSSVEAALEGSRQILDARNAGLLPGGAQMLSLPGAATTSGTIQCSTLGGGGSGSITYTLVSDDTTFRPVSYSYTYNNCTFGSGGYSYSYNGTGSITYDRYLSATDFRYTYAYDMTYSFTGPNVNQSGTIRTSQVCDFTGGQYNCYFAYGDNRVRTGTVTISGSVATITDARITTNDVEVVFSGWTYDTSARRATSGTVTITASNGNRMTITATSTGYTVVALINGTSTTYTVTFPN